MEYKASVGSCLDHFIVISQTKFCLVISKANFPIKTVIKQEFVLYPSMISVLTNDLVDVLKTEIWVLN